MSKKMTHIGIKVGCDSRTHDSFKLQISLRETKNFWIDLHGVKYRKGTGRTTDDWPMYKILIDSIKPITGIKDV